MVISNVMREMGRLSGISRRLRHHLAKGRTQDGLHGHLVLGVSHARAVHSSTFPLLYIIANFRDSCYLVCRRLKACANGTVKSLSSSVSY
jgi:hypothetical protein